jgi:hypothetical protein
LTIMPRLPLTSLLFVAALAQARGAAAAQPGASSQPQPPDAQTLFDRGVSDMEAGRFEKACPAIEASQRLEPMPGTLFTLAECEALRGRTATAMRYYAEYLAVYRTFNATKKAEQKDRAVTSEEQLKKLDLLTPRLTLKLPGAPPPDIVVKLDGDVVADLSIGSALPVDPGEHSISTQVPGGPEIEVQVSLSAAESRTVELRIVQGQAAPETGLGPNALSTATSRALPPPPDLRPWRIATWSAGATAIVGLAVGAVTGVLAIEQRGVMTRNCEKQAGLVVCNATGFEAKSRLESFGNASTVGFVAGGVGLGLGIALIFAAPAEPSPTPVQGVGPQPPTGAALPPFSITLHGDF